MGGTVSFIIIVVKISTTFVVNNEYLLRTLLEVGYI